jgi:hypothetical protein
MLGLCFHLNKGWKVDVEPDQFSDRNSVCGRFGGYGAAAMSTNLYERRIMDSLHALGSHYQDGRKCCLDNIINLTVIWDGVGTLAILVSSGMVSMPTCSRLLNRCLGRRRPGDAVQLLVAKV